MRLAAAREMTDAKLTLIFEHKTFTLFFQNRNWVLHELRFEARTESTARRTLMLKNWRKVLVQISFCATNHDVSRFQNFKLLLKFASQSTWINVAWQKQFKTSAEIAASGCSSFILLSLHPRRERKFFLPQKPDSVIWYRKLALSARKQGQET